jgi:hypothetical protein
MATKEDRFPSKFLNAQNMPTEVMVLTIDGEAENVDYPGGDSGTAISFKEIDKQFGVNVTCWDAIAQIAGIEDDAEWDGTVVELFKTKTDFKGKMVDCIRIRPVGGWTGWTAPAATEGADAKPF